MVLSETVKFEFASSGDAAKEPMSDHDDDCFKKEDRDELLKHGWQLAGIISTLKEMKDSAKEKSEDLETRIRALESFKWIVWGMGSIAGILLGWVLQLMGKK